MASTLILGCDRAALTMAKLLSSAGERVCLLGAPVSARRQLRDTNVNFCNRLTEVQNVQAVFAFNKDSLSDIRLLGSVPVAAFDGEADWHSHVSVKLYDPIESAMTAQIRISSNTDPTALSSIANLLEKIGFQKVIQDQPDALEEMLSLSKLNHQKPSMDDIVRTVLTCKTPCDLSNLNRI